jgi:hypothetical protein
MLPKKNLFCSAVWVVDGKQPSGKIKVQKLLDEVGLSLLDAANNLKSEWHNIMITRPEALAARLARHPGFQPKLPPNGPLLSPKGLHHPP